MRYVDRNHIILLSLPGLVTYKLKEVLNEKNYSGSGNIVYFKSFEIGLESYSVSRETPKFQPNLNAEHYRSADMTTLVIPVTAKYYFLLKGFRFLSTLK